MGCWSTINLCPAIRKNAERTRCAELAAEAKTDQLKAHFIGLANASDSERSTDRPYQLNMIQAYRPPAPQTSTSPSLNLVPHAPLQ